MGGGFLVTLHPTADEIVVAALTVSPTSADAEDLAAAEIAQGIANMTLPPIAARVWKGFTNAGHPIEVAIVQILKLSPVERERLQRVLIRDDLPSHFPKEDS